MVELRLTELIGTISIMVMGPDPCAGVRCGDPPVLVANPSINTSLK